MCIYCLAHVMKQRRTTFTWSPLGYLLTFNSRTWITLHLHELRQPANFNYICMCLGGDENLGRKCLRFPKFLPLLSHKKPIIFSSFFFYPNIHRLPFPSIPKASACLQQLWYSFFSNTRESLVKKVYAEICLLSIVWSFSLSRKKKNHFQK